jgi:hypothetical protein
VNRQHEFVTGRVSESSFDSKAGFLKFDEYFPVSGAGTPLGRRPLISTLQQGATIFDAGAIKPRKRQIV